jgi:hypothetical protein
MKHLIALACILFPLAVAARPAPPALKLAVRSFTGELKDQPFRHSIIDLDGDGNPDALVLMAGQDWCGSGGCTLLVFRHVHGKFELISRSTVADIPIRVSPETSHGWNALVVHSKGRGDVLLRFGGSRYPLNPSLQPLATQAQVLASTVVLN